MPFKDLQYEKTYLTNVICRVDFSPIAQSILDEISNKFADSIKDIFPKMEKGQTIEFISTIKNKEKIDAKREFSIYTFYDENRKNRVTLAYNYIFIEILNYKNFTDFNTLTEKVFSSFINLYKPAKYSRLGLRYINQIKLDRGNPFDWKEYIDPSLTYVVDKFLDTQEDLSRSISRIIINEDDHKVIFNYGFFNSEFPGKVRKKEFLLDYDCYTEDVDEKSIHLHIKKFNKCIKQLFEKSIKNGLRKEMVVVNE